MKLTSLEKYLKDLELNAAECGDPVRFWSGASLLLRIWTAGGIPTAHYDPRANRSLMPLYEALNKFGIPLRTAIDARAFSA